MLVETLAPIIDPSAGIARPKRAVSPIVHLLGLPLSAATPLKHCDWQRHVGRNLGRTGPSPPHGAARCRKHFREKDGDATRMHELRVTDAMRRAGVNFRELR